MAYILVPKKTLLVPQRRIVLPSKQRGFFAPFGGPGNSRKVGGADFDGTNDWMLRGGDLTGAPTSGLGIFSCWIRVDGGDNTRRRIFNGTSSGALANSRFSLDPNNKFQFTLVDGSTTLDSLSCNTSILAGSGWRHVLAHWDGSVTNGSRINGWLDGVKDSNNLANTGGTLDWTLFVDNWSVGSGTTAGSDKWNGALAELYVAPGQYLDFNIAANVLKFRTADGRPAYLGSDGSVPTGTKPLVYLRLRKNEAVANFATNRGSGGDFSITGALDYVAGP